MSSSVDLWYLLIYRNATVPGLKRYFRTPVLTGALFLSTFCTWRLFLAMGLSELFLATALLRGIYQ
jgi:hypothetical protein